MFKPKTTKFKKYQRLFKKHQNPSFFKTKSQVFSVIAVKSGLIKVSELETFSMTLKRQLKKTIKMSFIAAVNHSTSKRSPNTTLGGSKGEIDLFVARVEPGTVICTIQPFRTDLVGLQSSLQVIKKAANKFSVPIKIVYQQ